jgi:hypothetical protein
VDEPKSPKLSVLPSRVLTPVDRAYEMARSGCSDPEVIAALVVETGEPLAKIAALMSAPVVVERLEQHRLAGRGALRDYLYRVATTDHPTSATLAVTVWLSRQELAYGNRGIAEAVKGHLEELDGLSTEELKQKLRKAAGDL